MEVKDKNQRNYLFIKRGEGYLYEKIIAQVKKSNGNVSYTNLNELSMISKQVKFKLNRKLVSCCIADFRSTYKVIRQLNKDQSEWLFSNYEVTEIDTDSYQLLPIN